MRTKLKEEKTYSWARWPKDTRNPQLVYTRAPVGDVIKGRREPEPRKSQQGKILEVFNSESRGESRKFHQSPKK